MHFAPLFRRGSRRFRIFQSLTLGIVLAIASWYPVRGQDASSVTIHTTPTQAIFRYTAPDDAACSVQVSEQPELVPLVHDVDPALFPGSDTDARSELHNGRQRLVVVGLRTVAEAADGNTYSRALQANTRHYYRLTCGPGDFVRRGSFTTYNVPLGNSAPDPFPYDPNAWMGWGWPAINYADKSANYIDPQTGVLLKRWTSPGDEGGIRSGVPLPGADDLSTGNWHGLENIGPAADANYARYSGPGGESEAVFLWGSTGQNRPGFIEGAYSAVDDVRIHIAGYGDQSAPTDRTLSVCLSADHGQTCTGSAIDLVLPQSTARDVSGPPSFPAALFHGWGDAKVTADQLTNNFAGSIASISGNTVTWGRQSFLGSNLYFPVTSLKPSDRILISGTDPTCPNNLCTISAIANELSLTIRETFLQWSPAFGRLFTPVTKGVTTFSVVSASGFTAGPGGNYPITVESESLTCSALEGVTFSGCTPVQNGHPSGAAVSEKMYFLPNFGFKAWKKTGAGTLGVDAASSDWAASSNMSTGYQGAGAPYCSAKTVDANYAADGVTPVDPTPGYICYLQSAWGNSKLYWIGKLTGESRKLSSLSTFSPILSPGEPTIFYVYDPAGKTVKSCQYSVDAGNLAAFDDHYNNGLINPAISCKSLSEDGNNIHQEIAAAHPEIDLNYFNQTTLTSGHYPLFEFQIGAGQGRFAWFCVIDVSQPAGPQQVTRCRNDWDTYPVRWYVSHGSEYFEGAGYQLLGAQTAASAYGEYAVERWDMQLNHIYNNGGSTMLPASFLDPNTCEGLGVSDARWIFQGATGQNCIQININNEPVATAPNPGDLQPLNGLPAGARPGPWPHNASSCGGDGTTGNCWSYLQPIAEGDYIQDVGTSINDEKFLVARKTVLSDGTIDLVLARGMNPFGCRSYSGNSSHAANWTPQAWPPLSCASGFFHTPIGAGPSATVPDNPQTYIGHTVAWVSAQGIEHHLTANSFNLPSASGGYGAAYGVRSGPFPDIIGRPFQFGVSAIYPFAGSTAGPNNVVQAHPGGITVNASPRESMWAMDGRPLGGSQGGSGFLWKQSVSLVPGTQNVYRISLAQNMPLDRKRRATVGFAGYHLLQDISGPSSRIADDTLWAFCIADFAGECVPGSSAGNQYVSVPSASVSGACGLDGTIYAPCLAPMGPHVGAVTQFAIDHPDEAGVRWRKLTSAFNGPGRTNNYANVHPLSTGDWAVVASNWADGRRSDLFGIKLPAFPISDDRRRNDFIPVPVTTGGGGAARVRFGYDARLFCSSRQEQCSTAVANGDPYSWLSEPQSWQACDDGCTIHLPAASSRVLYYVVDHRDQQGHVSSDPMNVLPVN